MTHTTEQLKNLQDVAEFDCPFVVVPSGNAYNTFGMTFLSNVYAPEVYNDDDGDITIESDNWEALTGYTGQHRYNGAVMHASEYLGGGLAEDILSNPGVYVVTTVECLDDLDNPAGWCILKMTDK